MLDLHNRSVEILLVEDNPDDIDLTIEAFKESSSSSHLHVVEDGVEALEFLRRRGAHEAAPRPDLILLDLNLPRKSGYEVLQEIKTDPQLRQIPVVVLTTSEAEVDRARAYDANANSFLVKPLDFDQFRRMIENLELYWAVWNRPPI